MMILNKRLIFFQFLLFASFLVTSSLHSQVIYNVDADIVVSDAVISIQDSDNHTVISYQDKNINTSVEKVDKKKNILHKDKTSKIVNNTAKQQSDQKAIQAIVKRQKQSLKYFLQTLPEEHLNPNLGNDKHLVFASNTSHNFAFIDKYKSLKSIAIIVEQKKIVDYLSIYNFRNVKNINFTRPPPSVA